MAGTTACCKTGHKWHERSVEMTKIKKSKRLNDCDKIIFAVIPNRKISTKQRT